MCNHVGKQQLCLITNSFACRFAHNCSHMDEESFLLKVTVFKLIIAVNQTMMLMGKIVDSNSSRKACPSQPCWVAAFFMHNLGTPHRMSHCPCHATLALCHPSIPSQFRSHLCNRCLLTCLLPLRWEPLKGGGHILISHSTNILNACYVLGPGLGTGKMEANRMTLSLPRAACRLPFMVSVRSVLAICCCITSYSRT